MKKLSIFILMSMLAGDLCSTDFSRNKLTSTALVGSGKTAFTSQSMKMRDVSEQEKDNEFLKQEAAKILATDKSDIMIDGVPTSEGELGSKTKELRIRLKRAPIIESQKRELASLVYGNRVLPDGRAALSLNLEINKDLPEEKQAELEKLLDSYISESLAPNFNYDPKKEISYTTRNASVNRDFKSLRVIEKKASASQKTAKEKRDDSDQKRDADFLKQEAARILGVDKAAIIIHGVPDTKGDLESPVRYLGIEPEKPIMGKGAYDIATLAYKNHKLSTGHDALYFDVKVAGNLKELQREKLENVLNSYLYQKLAHHFNYDARNIFHKERGIEEIELD